MSDDKRLTGGVAGVFQPAGMTLARYGPAATDGSSGADQLGQFGGVVGLAAAPDGSRPAWQVSIYIGSDTGGPQGVGYHGGRGTTFMTLGESFVLGWAVGTPAPTTTDASVIDPVPPVALVHAYATWDSTSVLVGPEARNSVVAGTSFYQELVVATGVGTAQISAPGAIAFGCPWQEVTGCPSTSQGPTQTFTVLRPSGWSCSLGGGCTQLDAAQNSTPGYYDSTAS